MNKPIHALIYGEPGSGKSIFASTFPKCLYFDYDRGAKQYESAFPDNKYLDSGDLTGLLAVAIDQIKRGKFEYKTIVIDSLTNLENLAIGHFRGLDYQNWSKKLYSGNQRKMDYDDWGNISGSTITLLSYMRTLPVNVVIIAQIDMVKEDKKVRYLPNLNGKGQLESLHFADVAGFLYRSPGEKGDERYLSISSNIESKFFAKSRVLSGKQDDIKFPTYEKLVKVLGNTENKLYFGD